MKIIFLFLTFFQNGFKLSLLFIFINTNIWAGNLILNTEISPPYQVKNGKSLSGTSVESIQCILEKIDIDYTIKLAPWKRAQHHLKIGKSDGYFTSMSFDKVNKYGVLSAPIALEKWYIYFKNKELRKKESFLKNTNSIKFGVIRGSSQSLWLKENGYYIFQIVNTYEQLIKLLNIGRIDAYLADEKTFRDESFIYNLKSNHFFSKFHRYTPLGVYFSKKFLETKAKFMADFNKNIDSCITQILILTAEEREVVYKIAKDTVFAKMGDKLVLNAITKQNKKHKFLSSASIINLDKQYKNELNSSNKPLINKILKNSLSLYLKKIKKESKEVIFEMFVSDNKGLIVAQSDVTSDYWQGDELKFINTFQQNESKFIDEIKYDISTKKFQVQVSFLIQDPISRKNIGVLTVGLNIEEVLKSNNN